MKKGVTGEDMCAGEKETGATNIQNPEYRGARERGSQKGKKKIGL